MVYTSHAPVEAVGQPIEPPEIPPPTPGNPTEPPPEDPPGSPQPDVVPPPIHEPGEPPPPDSLPGKTPDEIPGRGPNSPTTPNPAVSGLVSGLVSDLFEPSILDRIRYLPPPLMPHRFFVEHSQKRVY
jgi:hypothetical protein